MKTAALQLCSQQDVGANLQEIESLVGVVARAGAELVLLPEAFAFLGVDSERALVAETLGEGGPIQDALSRMSREFALTIVAGGLPERSPDDARPYNTSIVFDTEGVQVACYRKIHLFDAEVEGGTSYRESGTTLPGKHPSIATVGEWKVGLSICYDLRFPELYAWQRNEGAQLLTVPAAFTRTTGEAHFKVLLQARAIENQCWVVAAGQEGRHPGGRCTFGHSMIVDPWGRIVDEKTTAGPGYVIADLTLKTVRELRAAMPIDKHRVLA